MKKSRLLNTLFDRGYVQDCTDIEGLDKLLSEAESEGKSIPIYIGFDMTAKSLHVGGLTQIMILRHIQKAGHKPVVLLGGGTTLIGDPSGRDESRMLLTDTVIAENTASISKVFAKYLEFGYNVSHDAITVNNAEWLKELKLVDFLRDIGKHFSVNKMLSFESVKRRLEREQNLSFLEFNYMIFQAYDFTVLNKKHGVRVQIGGSDQWGNIVNGTDLNRRLGGEELFGLTTPLLTTASGAKMGKSLSGAVWLDESMLSPYDFWQYWRNTEDADVVKFLKLFTDLPLPEIESLSKLEGADINKAKIILANEVTKMAHGESAAKEAHETAVKVFEQGAHGGSLPVYTVERDALEAGILVVQLFNDSGLAETRGAAKRLIQGGGAKVNGERANESLIVNTTHLNDEGIIKLSSGKKNHMLVKVKA